MDHKPTFSSTDNEAPCERGKMFRENEMSLPTEIKMEEMEHYSRNVEAFK